MNRADALFEAMGVAMQPMMPRERSQAAAFKTWIAA